MRIQHLATLLVIFGLISCQGGILETEELIIEENENLTYMHYSDSCTYTINSKTYYCNRTKNIGYSIFQVNPDPQTGWGYEDSLYISTGLQMETWNSSPESGGYEAQIEIFISKKFGKNELTFTNSIIWPNFTNTERNAKFKEGEYPYAIDFYRNNTQNGVSIMAYADSESSTKEIYRTYIYTPLNRETSIPLDAQKDSYFEITKIHLLSDGWRVVEAHFDATVFESTVYAPWSPTYEKATRLEKGYVRFKLQPDR